MPDFEFYPWEQLSPEITEGEATARVQVEGTQWLFRSYDNVWFVREASKEKREWNSVVCLRVVGIETYGKVWREELNLHEIAKSTRSAWEEYPRERVWKIEDVFVVWSPHQGWLLYTSFENFAEGEHATPFLFELPSPITQMPSSAVFSRLQDEWQNPNSDLRFSAHFASLPEEERALYGVQTRMETSHQMAHLLRSAMRAFAPDWPAEISTASLQIEPTGQWPAPLRKGTAQPAEDEPQRRFMPKDNESFGIRARAIFNHIIREFDPHPLLDSPGLPSTVRSLVQNNGWGSSFYISTTKPSRHEQMEALLELRTWLETYWPEGVKHLAKVV